MPTAFSALELGLFPVLAAAAHSVAPLIASAKDASRERRRLPRVADVVWITMDFPFDRCP